MDVLYKDIKEQAIKMRKNGFSYSEITQNGIAVSKSTLSLWLRGILLNKKQRQRLLLKTREKLALGAPSRIIQRKEKSKKIIDSAALEIPRINDIDLFLIGTVLYWAEGSKQKEHIPSQTMVFTNSDPKMIKLFIKWLLESVNIPFENLLFELYLHENKKTQKEMVIRYWSSITGYPVSYFDKIYYKQDSKNSYRKNQYENYHGLLRVKVRNSTDLNRKISGWINGICYRCGIV